jgi:hypothetical protein
MVLGIEQCVGSCDTLQWVCVERLIDCGRVVVTVFHSSDVVTVVLFYVRVG